MIPMGRPLLPSADALLPYLKRIDTSRWYSNAGPLVKEYEQRLGKLFGCYVAATANGTTGMTAALLTEFGNVRGHGCAATMPSWTFIATANAVSMAGFEPYFEDVQEDSWESSASIGVSPFGAPTKYIHSIIDAAGAFDAYASGLCKAHNTPVVISTHATKTFATGEGGMVLSKDEKFIHRVKEIINHGMTLERDVPVAGINGKMSEYHAAVGLAELDGWEDKRKRWLETKKKYMDAFSKYEQGNPIFDEKWVGSVFGIRIHCNVNLVIDLLAQRGITARQVWARGCHREKAYEMCQHEKLTVTEKLVDEILFLPFSIDIKDDEFYYVVGHVKEILECA